jgi:streptomycin 6-kinase
MTPLFEQLKQRAADWNVAIVGTRETEGSLLGFGVSHSNRVVIKVSKYDDESNSGEVLRAFEGAGVVKVLEFVGGCLLLEQLDPGKELVELVREGRDEEATTIFARAINRMANHQPPAGCPTLFDWALGFDRYMSEHRDGPISLELVNQAEQIYRQLAKSQKQTMLLHGDLHHYNVLFDTKRGWIAIDPKGVVGELEYELGAVIRNPVENPELFVSREVVERRLKALTTALRLDYERALGWSFAQAVLSAIWSLEDGFFVANDHPTIQLAREIRSMIN